MAFERIGADEQATKIERKKKFLEIMQEAKRQGKSNQKDAEGLTVKELKFVEHYTTFCNSTQAYIDSHNCGSRDADFTREKAAFNGCQLLKKPHIKAAIDRRRKNISQKYELEQERLILEYCRIAFSALTDYYYVDSNNSIAWRNPEELTGDQQAAIQDISIFENVVTGTRRIAKMKLYNKQTALDSLAKIMGLFDEYAKKKAPVVNVNIEEVLSSLPSELGDAVRQRIVQDLTSDEMVENRVIN